MMKNFVQSFFDLTRQHKAFLLLILLIGSLIGLVLVKLLPLVIIGWATLLVFLLIDFVFAAVERGAVTCFQKAFSKHKPDQTEAYEPLPQSNERRWVIRALSLGVLIGVFWALIVDWKIYEGQA